MLKLIKPSLVKNKLTYPIFFATMMISTTAMAKFQPNAFNYTTQYFKEPAYSPVLGEIGLQTGLFETIRFLGPLKQAFNEKGERDYGKDTSQDPLWNVVFSLFPSANGNFGTDSTSLNNLGRYVKDPRFVARLLTFAYDVRGEKKIDIESVEGELKKLMDNPHKSVFSQKDNKVQKLLQSILDSIKNEKESLFPKYTTEQAIESFFAHKFDKQSHINTLIENLPEEIVHKNLTLPTTEDFLKKETILKNIDKVDLSLDDIYSASLLDSYDAVLPYRSGENPISNGICQHYNREKNELLKSTFADCEEVGGRHFVNLSTLEKKVEDDEVKWRFNLENIRKIQEKFKEGPQYNKIQNLINFLQEQTPDLINSGDEKIRSLSNTIFADLNDKDENDPKKIIDYVKEANELETGFTNFIKVFQNIFALELPPSPDYVSDEEQRQWVKNSFETILKALNPNREYVIDPSKLEWKKGLSHKYFHTHDLHGSLNITVKENIGQKMTHLFSFTLNSSPTHFKVINLKYPTAQNFTLKGKNVQITQDSAEETVGLMLKNQSGFSPSNHFLRVFKMNLADNESKIAFIERAAEEWKHFKSSQRESLKAMMNNIFPSFSWDDVYFIRKFSNSLLNMMKNEENNKEFLSFVFPHVRSLSVDTLEPLKKDIQNFTQLNDLSIEKMLGTSESEILENLISLKKLNIDNINIENLKFLKNLQNLEELKISKEDWSSKNYLLSTAGLEDLSQLKKFTLEKQQNIETLNLKGSKNLEDLFIVGCKIQSIPGLEMQEKLKHLRVRQQITPLEINLSENNKSLETIDFTPAGLSNTSNNHEINFSNKITHINGLDKVSSLKELTIMTNSEIKQLTFSEKNDQLTKLVLGKTEKPNVHHIYATSKLQKINGFEHLTSLTELHAYATKEFEELQFFPSNAKLKILDFSASGIKKLDGVEHLLNLETFKIKNARNVKEITFGENNTNLIDVDLSGTSVEKVNISSLPNLETLDLSDTKMKVFEYSENNKKLKNLTLKSRALENETIDFSPFAGLINLTVDEHFGNEKSKVKSLKFGQNNKNVETIFINSLDQLNAIEGLEHLVNLRELYITNVYSIKTLSGLDKLEKLEKMTLKTRGYNLQEIKGLEKLPNLREVEIEASSVYEVLVKNKAVKVNPKQDPYMYNPLSVKYLEEDNL